MWHDPPRHGAWLRQAGAGAADAPASGGNVVATGIWDGRKTIDTRL